eukprot:SAG11_NODE_25921_length_352_cov_0.711462_2_plen_25_part_01
MPAGEMRRLPAPCQPLSPAAPAACP